MQLTCYRTLSADFYTLDKPAPVKEALDFYLSYAQAANGPVLEPMCGTGRFLIPMLSKGLPIEGLDASGDMLRHCRDAAKREGLSPTLYEQFLSEMQLRTHYGNIFIPRGSFGLLADTSLFMGALKRIYDHLLPGGTFVFEVETPAAKPKELETWIKTSRQRSDGSHIILHTLFTYQEEQKILKIYEKYTSLSVNDDLETEVDLFSVRYFNFEEMDSYLKEIGFSFHKYRPFTKEAPSSDDPLIVYVCKKET